MYNKTIPTISLLVITSFILLISCNTIAQTTGKKPSSDEKIKIKSSDVKEYPKDYIQKLDAEKIYVGADQLNDVLPLLSKKKVALVVNPTSMVGKVHLVDTLKTLKVDIKGIFAPEHGFRGKADAGEHINNEIDPKTGYKIISIYGDNKKPTPAQLKNIDVIVFDIQDVGARFYTYISTLHYVMKLQPKIIFK